MKRKISSLQKRILFISLGLLILFITLTCGIALMTKWLILEIGRRLSLDTWWEWGIVILLFVILMRKFLAPLVITAVNHAWQAIIKEVNNMLRNMSYESGRIKHHDRLIYRLIDFLLGKQASLKEVINKFTHRYFEWVIKELEKSVELAERQEDIENQAKAHMKLLNHYIYRPQGKRIENIDKAIKHGKIALEVYTPQKYPEKWAKTQENLARAYIEYRNVNRADNIEHAIYHCQQALEVYTQSDSPKKWGEFQSYLATAYSLRVHGDRAENLEHTINYFSQSLEVITRQADPGNWAAIHSSLAGAYFNRTRGDRSQNIERAIQHLQKSLKVFTRQFNSKRWAGIQISLSVIYSQRIQGSQRENMEQALQHLHQAEEVCTRQDLPRRWASIQSLLARIKMKHIQGVDKTKNISKAIQLYHQALEVITRQSDPEFWAAINVGIAKVYIESVHKDQKEDLNQAVENLQKALQVYTPQTFPQQCRSTAYLLGCLCYDESRFSEARQALTTAHHAIESLRGEIHREAAKRELSKVNADLYARLVFSCLHEGDEEAAFEYAIAGKGRAFVDTLASARFDLYAAGTSNPELAQDLKKARQLHQQIDNLLDRLTSNGKFSNSRILIEKEPIPTKMLRDKLRSLQQQAADHWEDMSYKYPALTATQKAPSLSVDAARTLSADLEATLIEYYQHTSGWCAFVINSEAIHHITLPNVNDKLLTRMQRWTTRIESRSGRGLLSYKILEEWYEAIITPLQDYLPQREKIILAPFGTLHLLPLVAARNPDTKRYAIQDYHLTFIPNLGALHIALEQAQKSTEKQRTEVLSEQLLNIAYPGVKGSKYYLPNVIPEAKAIAQHFTQTETLYEDDATPDRVVNQVRKENYKTIHLGCHGRFDSEHPQQSGLMLADGWLTVQRIITELDLGKTNLVTLGACVSGQVAIRKGEEHVGLLQAMMTAGASTIIASLWPVSDVATRALFEAFYTQVATAHSPEEALHKATQLVREQPGWSHPYYWAAFTVNGLTYSMSRLVTQKEQIEHPAHLNITNMKNIRGEKYMEMNEEQIVRDAKILLEQITEYPEEILTSLKQKERRKVLEKLYSLSKRANIIQDKVELLEVTDAIHRLVEDTPKLRTLLLPDETNIAKDQSKRAVTIADHKAVTEENRYIQEHAAQIHNRVIECRKRLEQALEEIDR